MAQNPPVPPLWGAVDTTYPAGSDPWSGLATCVAPSDDAWVPGEGVPAEELNYQLQAIGLCLTDIVKPYPEVLTGAGSWIVPANVTRVLVIMCGGGGGGAGGKTGIGVGNSTRGGGGGAGAIERMALLTVTPSTGVSYSVGSGGNVGVGGSTPTQGTDGGDTTFGSLTARGARPGLPDPTTGSTTIAPGGARVPQSASSLLFAIPGEGCGGWGAYNTVDSQYGGSSNGADGGAPGAYSATTGGGGGGGGGGASTRAAGGNGGDGGVGNSVSAGTVGADGAQGSGGGGGGGGGSGAIANAGKNGGRGGDGYLTVICLQ